MIYIRQKGGKDLQSCITIYNGIIKDTQRENKHEDKDRLSSGLHVSIVTKQLPSCLFDCCLQVLSYWLCLRLGFSLVWRLQLGFFFQSLLPGHKQGICSGRLGLGLGVMDCCRSFTKKQGFQTWILAQGERLPKLRLSIETQGAYVLPIGVYARMSNAYAFKVFGYDLRILPLEFW